MLPEDKTSDAARAAKTTFNTGKLSGLQIIAATITETKVIKKFSGRISFMKAVSFSINSIKMLLKDWIKLTKRKRFYYLFQDYNFVPLSVLCVPAYRQAG